MSIKKNYVLVHFPNPPSVVTVLLEFGIFCQEDKCICVSCIFISSLSIIGTTL